VLEREQLDWDDHVSSPNRTKTLEWGFRTQQTPLTSTDDRLWRPVESQQPKRLHGLDTSVPNISPND